MANFLEKGAPGLQTTARLVDDGRYWELNGEKVWALNSAGWDFGGADLSCVVCRDAAGPPGSEPADAVMILLVTRADIDASGPGAFQVLRHVETVGLASVSGPHIRYNRVRVPAENVLCPPGQGGRVAMATFDSSGVLVAGMAVGLMRSAFDAALAFARSDDRRGSVPLLERQAFADLLSGIKMATEACRALTWKAAHGLVSGPGGDDARRELANAAKVYCSEAAVKAVTDAIKSVGMWVDPVVYVHVPSPSCSFHVTSCSDDSITPIAPHTTLVSPLGTFSNMPCCSPSWTGEMWVGGCGSCSSLCCRLHMTPGHLRSGPQRRANDTHSMSLSGYCCPDLLKGTPIVGYLGTYIPIIEVWSQGCPIG